VNKDHRDGGGAGYFYSEVEEVHMVAGSILAPLGLFGGEAVGSDKYCLHGWMIVVSDLVL